MYDVFVKLGRKKLETDHIDLLPVKKTKKPSHKHL